MDLPAKKLDNPPPWDQIEAVMTAPVPSFFLYGEPPRAAEAGFLHLEPLDARSRPSDWAIRRHRHQDLNHVFLMTGGGGVIRTSSDDIPFQAPCLLFIPAGMIHGFAYLQESAGQVLTIASQFLEVRAACQEPAERLFDAPHVVACGVEAEALQRVFGELGRELAWKAPGHQAAVEGWILQAFVIALRRLHSAQASEQGGAGREAALVARYREQVELRYREHWPLKRYAQSLGVSLSHLHQVCRAVADTTPLAILQDRVLLEAKRGLHYSDMAIGDLAYNLGFDDAAYFSRFFTKNAGVSPRKFRQAR